MSRIKSPQDKKNASLERDRRNTYGENAKSSRKNIPQSKQLSHQAERRATKALWSNCSLVHAKELYRNLKLALFEIRRREASRVRKRV